MPRPPPSGAERQKARKSGPHDRRRMINSSRGVKDGIAALPHLALPPLHHPHPGSVPRPQAQKRSLPEP